MTTPLALFSPALTFCYFWVKPKVREVEGYKPRKQHTNFVTTSMVLPKKGKIRGSG
jgi:hypothetical protein